MSSRLLRRSFIYFFNLSSILCLKIDANENLKLSKVWALKNLMIFPFFAILNYLTPVDWKKDGIDYRFYLPTGLSIFFMYSFSWMMMLNILILGFCIFIQWWNREKNLKLILLLVKFHQDYELFNEPSFKNAEKKLCIKSFVFLSLFVGLNYFEFSGLSKLNWQGFLLFMFYPNNGFCGLLLLAFFNCFLSYFEFLFEFLLAELEKQNLRVYRRSNFDKIVSYTLDLHELIAEFEAVLEKLLTILMLLIIATTTVRVRSHWTNFLKRIFSYVSFRVYKLYAIAITFNGLIQLPWRATLLNFAICLSFIFCTVNFVIAPCHHIKTKVSGS